MIIFHMVICWFSSLPSPNAPRISYEVGTVEEHSPPLRVERSPAGGAFAGVLREEFLVQTKVSRGSREAPWELKGLPYIPAGGYSHSRNERFVEKITIHHSANYFS